MRSFQRMDFGKLPKSPRANIFQDAGVRLQNAILTQTRARPIDWAIVLTCHWNVNCRPRMKGGYVTGRLAPVLYRKRAKDAIVIIY